MLTQPAQADVNALSAEPTQSPCAMEADSSPPSFTDVLRADIGRLQRGFGTQRARAGRLFAILSSLLKEKRGSYQMRILYFPPLSILWSSRASDGSPASFLHQFYGREVWRERGVWARIRLLAAFGFWPIVTAALIVWFSWLNGEEVTNRSGKRTGRQVVEQLHVAAMHGVLPPWYYMYELFDDDKRRRAGEYLHRHETKGGIYRFIKRAPRGRDRTPLQDKLHFARWCRDHAIPSAPVLLAVENGEFQREFLDGEMPAMRLPAIDLFVKPVNGRGGLGAERWHWDGEGRFVDGSGSTMTLTALVDHFKRDFLTDGCLVQPRLTNHSAIADLSNGALSTVRVMTIEDERGGIEPTHAVFRMAIGGNTTVDNFHAGGIAAKVDLDTGELGRASDLGLRPDVGWCDVHPDTGAPIRGRVLPYWRETLDLVARAHAEVKDRVVIGWDVAILEDGPAIIEGNSGPDVDILQRIEGQPLGNSRFGELLALHVSRALEARAMDGAAGGTEC